MNRVDCDNALLAFAVRVPRMRRVAEAAAWIAAYGSAIGGVWYGATAVRAMGWL